jgi:hypothetical protein
VRNVLRFILILSMSLLALSCERPPSGKAIFRAAFLRVTNDSFRQPLSIAIAFPKCAHEVPFGTGRCKRLHCNVVVANRTRDGERERMVCEKAERTLVPLLRDVRTEDECEEILFMYALHLVSTHEVDADSFKENGSIEVRVNFLPRSFRESYGDSAEPPRELRQVWEI